jgi:hypothetical protein
VRALASGPPPETAAPAPERLQVADVYVVTNNHVRGQAPANAKMLESMVERRKVEAPPELVRTYPEALAPFASPAAPPGTTPALF